MNWIDVTKQEPNEYEDVLVHDDDGHIYTATLHIDGDRHFINDCSDGTLITHWMPLPAPPSND